MVMTELKTERGETADTRSKLSEPVHIWAGDSGAVLCRTAHPMIVVRFDSVGRFSRESLCDRCVAAWQ